ncbi:PREDICTED: cingulin isoform X1 [Fragaria vesca subsp. vesca]|uniref:cingulin isoform X1 n=1 Tax=Fragaria vesca subsp. vesca TaxID=101020 RepID=UPI0002C33254|nr:PREDICTED: cingulin isoform X1 [Fragaria vesca subsp. vesca]
MSFTTTVTATRRPKRLYPPAPPTPKILHLPRRPRRRTPKSSVAAFHGKPAPPTSVEDNKGKLVALFDQERVFSKDGFPIVLVETERRRERVSEEEGGGADVEVAEEEKWRFQAEMLRAECNLLRMEKEIVVKKMERIRVKMERTLNSAVHTLVSGRKKISEGRNATMVLEEEIQQLVQKLEKLQRNLGAKGMKVRKSSNLDKQACLLQRRLEKFRGTSDEICVKEIQEMAEASLSIKPSYRRTDDNLVSSGKSNTMQVEILRRRMEGLSNGMLLKRMKEEYGSMLSTANNSVASSASSSKRIESTDLSSSLEKESHDEKVCSGRCKAIVRRIVEQVRAETEQWSQMQEMLGQVREEMEELQASRDFWEERALDSDYHIQSLTSTVQEWREKAVSSESKARGLQEQVSSLHVELNSLRKGEKTKLKKENRSPNPWDPQNEMEKRVLICHLKENHCTKEYSSKQREALLESKGKPDSCTNRTPIAPHALKISPFRDIGNSSMSLRQHSRAVFPLHCPLPFKT